MGINTATFNLTLALSLLLFKLGRADEDHLWRGLYKSSDGYISISSETKRKMTFSLERWACSTKDCVASTRMIFDKTAVIAANDPNEARWEVSGPGCNSSCLIEFHKKGN